MTKLNKKRIQWLVDQVVKHSHKAADVALVYGITPRRVQQLVRDYNVAKKYPALKSERRPKTILTPEQQQAIDTAYHETKLTARLLYFELKRRGSYAPKNKLYAYLKQRGFVRDEPNKQKKRKRCRYEREHTGSLIHGDYHRSSEKHPHCIIWLDDASRYILAAGEFKSPSAYNAIATLVQAQEALAEFKCPIQQVNTDRGAAFFANKSPGISQFQNYCEQQGMKFIPSRVNNPQTNGKVERRWREYDRHRWRFATLQEWVAWHNDRLTTALDIDHYETPKTALVRKLPNLLALFWERIEHE